MKGKITVSMDFEAGWGVIGNGVWRAREAAGVYRELRPTLKRFVKLLDDLEISCVWAPVGAMIDHPANRDFSHLKGTYSAKVNAFLAESEPDTHAGRDLLNIVLSARQKQYFGTHGYSHVLFTDEEQDEQVIKEEIRRARLVNASLGIDAEFLVFPENRSNYLDAVYDSGIRVVRMPPIYGPVPEVRRRTVRRVVELAAGPVSDVSETLHTSGLKLHAGTQLLNWGANSNLAKRVLLRTRIKKVIHHALSGHHVHLWLHPFNLVETPGLEEFIATELVKIGRARDADRLDIEAVP